MLKFQIAVDFTFAYTLVYYAAQAIFNSATVSITFGIICGFLSIGLTRACIGLKREPYPIEDWNDLLNEDAIDPSLCIIDPHHHLWDARCQPKGWPVSQFMINVLYKLKPSILCNLMMADIKKKNPEIINTFSNWLPLIRPYMAREFIKDISNDKKGHNVIKTVYIECGWLDKEEKPAFYSVNECRMAQEVHYANESLCNGIIGFIDLRLGAEEVEPALKEIKTIPNVKGIRHSLAFSKDEGILSAFHVTDENMASNKTFRSSFAQLKKYGLVFDCWLYHHNLPGLIDLARDFPEQTIICDHVGQPLGIQSSPENVYDEWMNSMTEQAQCNNVYVKQSGLAMRVCGFMFDERPVPPTSRECATQWGPYFKHCVDKFGFDRCMFASNFPVDGVSCSYTVLWNSFKIVASDYGWNEEQKNKLFHDNAKMVYSL